MRDPLCNEVLGRTMQKQLERVGAPRWDERDIAFAKALQKELGAPEAGMAADIVPFGPAHGSTASSDVGEVSAAVPLAELNVAATPLGVAFHHWGTTACAVHPLGLKGMMVAAKVMGASLADLLGDPAAVAAAKAEFARSTEGKPYQSPLPAEAKPLVF